MIAFLTYSSIITLSNQDEAFSEQVSGSLQVFLGIYISSKRQGHSLRYVRFLILYRIFLDHGDESVGEVGGPSRYLVVVFVRDLSCQ